MREDHSARRGLGCSDNFEIWRFYSIMIYLLIRFSLCIIIFALTFFLLKEHILLLSKKAKILVLLSCFMVFYLSLLVPFESVFLKFDTPEDSFHYSFINQNIIKTMEADDCAFVIYGTDGSQLNYTCIPKNGNQYQVRSAYLSPNIEGAFKDSLYICRVENKAGHSQLITVSQGNLREPDGKKTVNDSIGNTFSYFNCKYKSVDYYTDVYWTVTDLTELSDYVLTVDGESIRIK